MLHSDESTGILGYKLFLRGVDELCSEVVNQLRHSSAKTWFACLNPHSYVVARSDAIFQAAMRSANWLVPDGIGIVFACRVLGCRIRGRITGWDVFQAVSEALNREAGHTVFFLGSSPENLNKIAERFASDYPNIQIVGRYSPPFVASFSERDNDAMLSAINEVRPDVLWVGLTAPKQEKWIFQCLDRADVRFVGAIGAVFDFYSGRVQRPGSIARRLGLEWLVRLLREPRRLWTRTFVSVPMFLLDVGRGLLASRKPMNRK